MVFTWKHNKQTMLLTSQMMNHKTRHNMAIYHIIYRLSVIILICLRLIRLRTWSPFSRSDYSIKNKESLKTTLVLLSQVLERINQSIEATTELSAIIFSINSNGFSGYNIQMNTPMSKNVRQWVCFIRRNTLVLSGWKAGRNTGS